MEDPYTPKKIKKYINDCSLLSCFKENSAQTTEQQTKKNPQKNPKPEKVLKPTLKDVTQQFFFWEFQQLLFLPDGMGCCSLAHSEAAQAAGILSQNFCHTQRAFPFFFLQATKSLWPKEPPSPTSPPRAPRLPNRGADSGLLPLNIFVSASCPFPGSPGHCSTSDLRCQDPVWVHLYKYRREAPRHCQDVCITQVRGRRENRREAGA